MERINMTDSTTWFDAEKATRFDEKTYWDGSDWVSRATGSKWYHEAVYRTVSGRHILYTWSNYEATPDRYEPMTDDAAYEWLAKNDHADAIPPEQDDANNLDTPTGPTPIRHIRISDELWDAAKSTGNPSKLAVDLLAAHFSK